MLIEATAPTRRMSAKEAQRRRAQRKCATLRPAAMYQPSASAVSAVVATTAAPAPAMPSAGTGPSPKIRSGDNGTSRTTPTQIHTEGTHMLPLPRMTLASAFISHTSTVPANTIFE